MWQIRLHIELKYNFHMLIDKKNVLYEYRKVQGKICYNLV